MIKSYVLSFTALLLTSGSFLNANTLDESLLTNESYYEIQEVKSEVKGKVDVSPVFVHLDILESGRTIDRLDMLGIRSDFSYIIHRGLYIKPTILYANGGSNKGGIFTSSLGIGYLIPLDQALLISPSVGIGYGHIWTKVDFPQFQLKNLSETFKSWAPFVQLDIHYTFLPKWRISAGIQYSWSRCDVEISKIGKSKNKSQGFAYSLLLENDFADQWSWNVGVAYNLSLSKEKHGLRGTGLKAGIVRWF